MAACATSWSWQLLGGEASSGFSYVMLPWDLDGVATDSRRSPAIRRAAAQVLGILRFFKPALLSWVHFKLFRLFGVQAGMFESKACFGYTVEIEL